MCVLAHEAACAAMRPDDARGGEHNLHYVKTEGRTQARRESDEAGFT